MKWISFLAIFLQLSSSYAWDSAKCSKMLNDGLYKKYKFGGIGDANANAITGETKKSGSTSASSATSTEGSTALLDPKYYSNITTSEGQSTSSTGDCSLFALKERETFRNQYFAQNEFQIMNEIAQGGGMHIEDLAWLSLCDNDANLEKVLQANFSKFLQANKNGGAIIDQIVYQDPDLKTKCYNLSQHNN